MRVITKKDKFKPEKLSAQEASLAKKKTMLSMYQQDLENPVLVRNSQTVIYWGGGGREGGERCRGLRFGMSIVLCKGATLYMVLCTGNMQSTDFQGCVQDTIFWWCDTVYDDMTLYDDVTLCMMMWLSRMCAGYDLLMMWHCVWWCFKDVCMIRSSDDVILRMMMRHCMMMWHCVWWCDFHGCVQDTIFKSMDADGDGKIDFKEFLVAVGMS